MKILTAASILFTFFLLVGVVADGLEKNVTETEKDVDEWGKVAPTRWVLQKVKVKPGKTKNGIRFIDYN